MAKSHSTGPRPTGKRRVPRRQLVHDRAPAIAVPAGPRRERRPVPPGRRRVPLLRRPDRASRSAKPAGRGGSRRDHPPRHRARVQAPPPRTRVVRRRAGSPRFRLIAALVVIVVMFLVIVARVAALQTTEADAYRAEGAAQWTRSWAVPAQRGTLFDRNGNEMAISVPAATISINPKLIENGPATIQLLDDLLGAVRREGGRTARRGGHQGSRLRLRRTPGRLRHRRADLRARPARCQRRSRGLVVRCPVATRDAASSGGPTSTASASPASSCSTTTS